MTLTELATALKRAKRLAQRNGEAQGIDRAAACIADALQLPMIQRNEFLRDCAL